MLLIGVMLNYYNCSIPLAKLSFIRRPGHGCPSLAFGLKATKRPTVVDGKITSFLRVIENIFLICKGYFLCVGNIWLIL
jgi:hypothetical protein